MKKIALSQFPLCLSLIPEKGFVAIGGSEGILELLNLQSGKISKARANSGRIEAICCTPEGNSVVTGSYGEIIKWHVTL